MPSVSVIIPTYNCGKYISTAIDSVLNQSFKDVEVIVIDDGSQDETKDVLSSYKGKLRYYFQNNCGPANARNEAIKKAQGVYIAFLDADDQWKPSKLEMQVCILEKIKDICFLFTNYDLMDEEGHVMADSMIENGFPVFKEFPFDLKSSFQNSIEIKQIGRYSVDGGIVYYGNIFKNIFMGNFILPSTTIFRKDCLSSGICFDERFLCAEDQDFHLKFSRNHIFSYIENSTIYYRINRKDKLSGNKNTLSLITNTIRSRDEFLERHPEFIQKNASFTNMVMARHFSRLAYYYLSICDRRNAAIFACRSLSHDHWHMKAWAILSLAQVPNRFLGLARTIKAAI